MRQAAPLCQGYGLRMSSRLVADPCSRWKAQATHVLGARAACCRLTLQQRRCEAMYFQLLCMCLQSSRPWASASIAACCHFAPPSPAPPSPATSSPRRPALPPRPTAGQQVEQSSPQRRSRDVHKMSLQNAPAATKVCRSAVPTGHAPSQTHLCGSLGNEEPYCETCQFFRHLA